MKVAIIGAGNVGAMVAARIIDANLSDVVLVDIIPGLAKGKALDISDSRFIHSRPQNCDLWFDKLTISRTIADRQWPLSIPPKEPMASARVGSIIKSNAAISGTEDFSSIKGSDIVVITAGLARKPGMSRDDLLRKNSEIVRGVSLKIKKYAPSSIILTVTNPLDVMTYLVMKTVLFMPARVIGMAGALDTARFMNILSDKKKNIREGDIFIIGSHADTMVPINRSKLDPKLFRDAGEGTRNRGAEIVRYLGSGSAYFAPSKAVFHMLKCIIKNEESMMTASVYLNGEYGERDIYIGVPVILNSSGVKKIIEIELTEQEKMSFKISCQEIRENIKKVMGD